MVFTESSLPYYGALSKQFFPAHVPRNGETGANQLNNYAKVQQQQQQQNAGTALRQSAHTKSPSAAFPSIDPVDEAFLTASASFEQDFQKIQLAAARLVAIQEVAKRKGVFTPEDNQVYANSLLELGQAAQNLALLQQTGQIKDFSVLLQPTTFLPQKQPMESVDPKVEEQKVDEVTELQLSESDLLPPNPEDPYEDVNDSVAISAPKKDASVAEAKPVGLSIAGEGGVASSKPNAVALSGRNGLAVASPKATAIAGVTPEEAAAFSISLPNRNQLVIKGNSRITYNDDDYDYNDLVVASAVPSTSLTRDQPLTRSSNPTQGQSKNNNNYHRVVYTKPQSQRSNSSPAIIDQWKAAIAEEQQSRSAKPHFFYRYY